MRPFLSLLLVQFLIFGLLVAPVPVRAQTSTAASITPIKHLVVIFQENISFDHYFGTYPVATNPEGEPSFTALANTPSVNGLTDVLMTRNPNSVNTANGTGAVNPFRLDRSQAATTDQNHNYGPEQSAVHGGMMDLFPSSTGTAGPPPTPPGLGFYPYSTTGINMGYYDGNTVTALWNYAQHFAMSDNSYDTNFGPSTTGAVNLISGQTNGVTGNINGTGSVTNGGNGTTTDIGDADPLGDVCSTTTGELFSMTGTNHWRPVKRRGRILGLLHAGLRSQRHQCQRDHRAVLAAPPPWSPPRRRPITSRTMSRFNTTSPRPIRRMRVRARWPGVGYTDAANHQYDMHDFYDAINAGNFPAVSFLKAPGYQDGHAGYSDPLDEQAFIVSVINFLQQSSEWESTAVVISYDDSDGWYDHQMGPIVNQSSSPADTLNGAGSCGTGTTSALTGPGTGSAPVQGRCGYGPRLPLLVVSPWAKQNFVDHTVTDQTSIIRFVEDNWLNGTRIGSGSFDGIANSISNMLQFTKANKKTLILDPNSGQPVTP